MGPTCILPGGQYWSVDPDKGGEVAQSMGEALGLSEFKVTTPLAQGTCILIHFHMYHRGSARLENPERTEPWAVSREGPAPMRPMVKFQFYSVSEPTQPNWDAGPLGQPGAKADWGELDGVHGACADSPQVTAVWDDILGWLRGDKLLTAPPSAPSALAETVAQFETEDVAGEPRRMGCAFLVGREAGGGSGAALAALEDALRSDKPARQRCGIWGCVGAGDAATSTLLGMLGERDLGLVTRAGTALGESSQHPSIEVVEVIGATIERLLALTDLAAEGLSLEFVKAERQLATFASKGTKERYRRPEWHAMDVLAQALWCADILQDQDDDSEREPCVSSAGTFRHARCGTEHRTSARRRCAC